MYYNFAYHGNYPQYCDTREEAEECADKIAKSNGLPNKTREDEYNFIYENDELILKVRIFKDNWHGPISCYSFTGSVVRKDIELEEGLPYQRFIGGQFSRQCWRKCPSYFASDISESIRNLLAFDSDGKVLGNLYKWVQERGFGFANCVAVSKVFVHIKQIPYKDRKKIREGVTLKFRIVEGEKGPKAEEVTLSKEKVQRSPLPF